MMKFMTLVFAACTLWAFWDLMHGDPGAINGVIGAGAVTVVFAAISVIER